MMVHGSPGGGIPSTTNGVVRHTPRGVNPATLEAELDSPLAARAGELIAQATRRRRSLQSPKAASPKAHVAVDASGLGEGGMETEV